MSLPDADVLVAAAWRRVGLRLAGRDRDLMDLGIRAGILTVAQELNAELHRTEEAARAGFEGQPQSARR